MGFDVTFHPVSESQLQRYLADVLADHSVAEQRAAELAPDPKERDVILKLYNAMPNWVKERIPIANSFAMGAAIIAGFLHPYWYARGTAFTFLAEERLPEMVDVFVPLGKVIPALGGLPDRSRGMIRGNESASGLIPADGIKKASELLESLGQRRGRGGLSLLETVVDEEGLSSLRAVLEYCSANNLGMIEASDVVVPISSQCLTKYSNLRESGLL